MDPLRAARVQFANSIVLWRHPIWDEWNIAHIALHHIIPDEVQEVCDKEPVVREGHKQRIFLIDLTKKARMLTIILEPTDQKDAYRPITAYDASKRSRQDHADEKKPGR